MNKLELFSGIGGFTKGFEEAGFEFDNVYYGYCMNSSRKQARNFEL